MAKTTKADAVRVKAWIAGVTDANHILQRQVSRHGADLPPAVLKALSDVDWACKALVAADALWTPDA